MAPEPGVRIRLHRHTLNPQPSGDGIRIRGNTAQLGLVLVLLALKAACAESVFFTGESAYLKVVARANVTEPEA